MAFDENKLRIHEEGFGLFLGAGASYQAGYPLMDGLTKQVIKKLPKDKIEILSDLIHRELQADLDVDRGCPNIEVITDVVENRIAILNQGAELNLLSEISIEIREHIINTILEIKDPELENHIKLFTAIKTIFTGRPCPIWVITTNYDLLIEVSAAIVGMPVYDGFVGSSLRYFDVSSFRWKFGTLTPHGKNQYFAQINVPHIKLIKIHGSVNWWNDGQKVYSAGDHINFSSKLKRNMVHPRKRKVVDILDPPFDSLWRVASEIIGSHECKYLTTLGYSFGDAHINDGLLLPKLQQNHIFLNALVKSEDSNMDAFRGFKNFQLGTEENTKLWDFKMFSDYLFSTVEGSILRRVP